MTPDIVVGVEPWGSIWPECEGLVAQHWAEVRHEMPRRLNLMALADLSRRNLLLIVTARRSNGIVGYFTWTITEDLESAGTVIANQGAWFLAPGYPRAAVTMFDRSIQELRLLGVQYAWPHHRLYGRGKDLGKFFHRRGAVPTQLSYSLRIEE